VLLRKRRLLGPAEREQVIRDRDDDRSNVISGKRRSASPVRRSTRSARASPLLISKAFGEGQRLRRQRAFQAEEVFKQAIASYDDAARKGVAPVRKLEADGSGVARAGEGEHRLGAHCDF
jgi:hypothetical protein